MATIEFTAPRAHSFPYSLGETQEGKPNSYSYIQLQPGLNLEFPDAVLEKIRNHPDFRAFCELGLIKFIDDPNLIEPKDLGGVQAVTSGKLVGDGQPLPVSKARVVKSG